jgi:hypothetical protein
MGGLKSIRSLLEVVLYISDARSVAWYTSMRVTECILTIGMWKLL